MTKESKINTTDCNNNYLLKRFPIVQTYKWALHIPDTEIDEVADEGEEAVALGEMVLFQQEACYLSRDVNKKQLK